MRNEEYGRSAIKLIFTIIILALVIAGIIFTVKRLWQDTSVKDVETDLLSIQAKCKGIYVNNKMDSNKQLLGEKVVDYSENEEVNNIVSQSDKWYKLGQQDLETMGLTTLKAEDGYLVNYEEEDIIYAKGIERDNEIYYKLSELQKVQEQEEQEEQQKQQEQQEQQEQQTEEQPEQNPETEVLEGHGPEEEQQAQ